MALFAALASPAHSAINANKSFSPDVVTANQPSTVTIFFLNANNNPATGLAFTDTLPVGVVVAPAPDATSTCGGTLTANAGDPSFSFSGGTIPPNAGLTPGSCEVTFNVVAAAAGVYINTIVAGGVTSSEGTNSQPAEATLNVSTLAPLSGTKSFAPTSIHGNGNPSTVTIVLTNPNGIGLSNLAFVDTLPVQLVIAPTPNVTNTCGGTPAAVAGANNFSITGGAITANGACTITFAVVAATPNTPFDANVTNTLPAGSITTFEGVTNPLITSNNLRVQTGAQVAKAFAPGTIDSGGVSTLTVTVRNFNATTALAPLAFTDALPAGMTITNPVVTGGTCVTGNGASFSVAAPGGTSFTTAGGSLPGVAANAGVTNNACTFTIQVTASNASVTPLVLSNSVPAGNFGGVNYATSNTATLTVRALSPLTASTKAFSLPNGPAVQTNWVRATITIRNSAASPVNNLAVNDLVTATMGAGYTFGTAEAPTTSCGGTFNAAPSATVNFSGGTVPASGNCVLTFPVQIGPTASTGNRTNTIAPGGVTGTVGGAPVTNTSPISAVLGVGAALGLSKTFAPTTVLAGTDSRLTINLSHANGAVAFTNLAVIDTLPAGHLVSNTPNLVTTCAGTVTATSATNIVSLSGGGLGTGATSCSIAVNVTTPGTAGSSVNSIPAGGVTTTQGVTNGGAANATLNRVSGIVSLAKSFDPATVALGGTSTMRVRVLNNQTGAVALSGVALTDALPAGMVIHTTPGASWSGTGCTGGTGVTAPPGGSTVSISGKSIAAGAICTIEVTVRATAAGNLINQVGANALVSMQAVTNIDPVAATLSSTGVADLLVTKTNGLTQIVAGTNVVYTVVVSNAAGGADVAGATFTDAVPPGMTFAAWTCTPSGTGTCAANGSGPINDVVSLPAGQSLTYSITMSVPASATGSITNTATITPPASVIDTNPNNNTASDTDPIVQTIALGITKTDNSLTYTPGGVGTYVVVVTNAGPSDASNLGFGDTLPAGVTIRAPGVTCTPAGTASCGSAGANTIGTSSVSFSAMTIAAGAGNEVTITVPVDFAPGMTVTPLVNTASVQRGTEPPVTADDSSTRAPNIVLDVDKDDGTTTYQPGANGTYTIVVANDGLTTAGDVALADTLPTGVTVRAPGVTCSPTAGSGCGTVTGAAGDSTLGTTGASILPAGELTFTVPVTFGASMTAASITNTAVATAADPELPPPGSVTTQDDDTNTLVLPDLTIDKSHTGNFFQGQVGVTFSIVVSNIGSAPTLGVVSVSDTLPAGLTATGIAGTGWTCGQPIGPCTRSDVLAPAASYPAITLTVDVAANAGSPLVNSTTVSGGGEQDTSNNTDTDSVTVDSGPDPTITKTHVGNFYQGQVGAAFTITVTNAGGVATVGTITVSDLLPGGLTATSISGTGWTCAPPGGPCTHPGPLAPAASLPVLTLIVDVAANAGSPLVNQATVSGGGDVNPNNNTASDPVTVAAGIDLAIAKSHTGNFVRGQAGTFTIVVSNVGGTASSGTITVTDTLPAGLTATAISGAGPDWSCTLATLTCSHPGPLAPGASLPAITLVVNVAVNAGSPLVNSTTVTGGADNDPSNNTATDSVTVVSPPPNDAAAPIPVHTPAGLALMALLVALFGAGFARARAKR